ncbi:MAG: AAA family ATPase, partial [Oscillospiraceae bacterium]|nr:AAA family ATPase [Oscillospiraceae bacterium]
SEDWMASALDSLVASGRVICDFVAGENACYLPQLFEAETSVYKRFTSMTKTKAEAPAHLEEVLGVIQAGLGIEYAPGQLDAIRTAATSNVMLLTGGPGTGKTTTVKGILALFEHMGLKVLLAAPTGRAAKRMSELSQTGAATVHRLLSAQADAAGQTIFTKNQDNPLIADAVILDETSMVDIELMAALLKAMKSSCRLIMIGDADQLPSVGAGRLLSDVIRSGTVPCVRLTEVFRQAEDSGIITAAHGVCRGEAPAKRAGSDLFFLSRPDGEAAAQTVTELCAKRLPLKMGIPADQIQVITPTRKGPCGSVHLNMLLREALNPSAKGKTEIRIGETVFRVGDRVMQSRNNYDLVWKSEGSLPAGMGVFNGDIGVISEIEPFSGIMTVDFEDHLVEYTPDDLADLEPAWAITVHKAQGSEFRAVVFAVCQVPRPLEIRSLFYTGLTRARELLVLVGDEQTTARMCANDRQKNRYSGLRARLAQMADE